MNVQKAKIAWLATIGMTFFMFGMLGLAALDISIVGDSGPEVAFLLTPAGYAFMIWFFIYGGMCIFGYFQKDPEQLNNARFVKARPYILPNALANALWFIGDATNQLWLTVICIIIMLITLIQMSNALEIGRSAVSSEEFWKARLPVTLYFGWVSMATPINITSWLLDMGIGLQSPVELWTLVLLLVAFLIVSLVYLLRKSNYVYLLVAIWAFIAIGVENLDKSNLIYRASFGISAALILTLILTIRTDEKRLDWK